MKTLTPECLKTGLNTRTFENRLEYLNILRHLYLNFWSHEYLNFWRHEYPNFWRHKHLNVWTHSWIPERLTTRIPERLTTRLPERLRLDSYCESFFLAWLNMCPKLSLLLIFFVAARIFRINSLVSSLFSNFLDKYSQ